MVRRRGYRTTGTQLLAIGELLNLNQSPEFWALEEVQEELRRLEGNGWQLPKVRVIFNPTSLPGEEGGFWTLVSPTDHYLVAAAHLLGMAYVEAEMGEADGEDGGIVREEVTE